MTKNKERNERKMKKKPNRNEWKESNATQTWSDWSRVESTYHTCDLQDLSDSKVPTHSDVHRFLGMGSPQNHQSSISFVDVGIDHE